MYAADYDRFAVVIPAPAPVREAVAALRRRAPPSGRPMMAAHVTVKGSFIEPTDLSAIAAWIGHCCDTAEPATITARVPRVWRNEATGLATVVLTVEPTAALVRLHWHLVEHLRGLATTDYHGEDIGSFHPHLTLMEALPPSDLDVALRVVEAAAPAYTLVATEATLCGRRGGHTWETLAAYPLGSTAAPTVVPAPGDTTASPAAVTSEVASFQLYILSSLDRLVALVGALDEADLSWRPAAPGSNSLHALAVHTLGNAEENILATLGGQAIARQREREFAPGGLSAAALQARWEGLRAGLTTALARLGPADLDRTYQHPRRGPLTGREILLVVARHAAEHLGQAELTRDLLHAAKER
jgi:2'-5' RNA ligase